MKEKLTKQILDEIISCLGERAKHFIIEHDETYDQTDDEISISVSFTPRADIEIEDGKIEGKTQSIQFNNSNDESPVMILGEDTEVDISAKDIFACLYWGEVCKPK